MLRAPASGLAVLALALLFGCSAARAEIVRLDGDLGYEPQVLQDLAPGTIVDARGAVFRVANSGRPEPTAAAPCDSGELPVNRYPIQLRDSPGATFRAGLFAGEVPQSSDWESTYCNSAALALRDAPGTVIEDLRMRRVWDAVRVAESSAGFRISGIWLSDVRDDCVENDQLQGGEISDSLFDGCFSGISMRPPEDAERTAAGGPLIVRGLLMRLQSYPYKGKLKQGVPFKVDEDAPRIDIRDSVIAMDNPESVSKSRLGVGWSRLGACRNNLLLWMADTPWPRGFRRPPGCFRLISGGEARAKWQALRQNWIDCHSTGIRFSDDPRSRPSACNMTLLGSGGRRYAD